MPDGETATSVRSGGDTTAWWCAIHGTVTRCPFRYMNCDANDTPNLTPSDRSREASAWLEGFGEAKDNDGNE